MYARPYIMRVACPDRNNVRYDRASCVTAPFAILLLLLLNIYSACVREFFVSLIKKRAHMGDILLSTTTSPGDISSSDYCNIGIGNP